MDLNRFSSDKIFLHLAHLQSYIKEGDCYPLHMVIGLTDYCNQHCIWCYSAYSTHDNMVLKEGEEEPVGIRKKRKDLTIETETLLRFLSEARERGLRSVSLVGSGEPLIHPDLTEILYRLKDEGIETGIYSNGCLMDEAKITAIMDCCTFFRVSIDAASSSTYKTIHRRNADFSLVIRNIEKIMTYKSDTGSPFPTVGAQFVASQSNYREIPAFAKLMRSLEIQYVNFKPMMENPLNKGTIKQELTLHRILPLLKRAKEYETESFQVFTKEEEFQTTLERSIGTNPGYNNAEYYKVCYGHPFVPALHANGDLYLCVNLGGRYDSLLGNIYSKSLKEIWESGKRKKAIEGIDLIKKCPAACRLDPLNRILWDLKNANPEIHPNFI